MRLGHTHAVAGFIRRGREAALQHPVGCRVQTRSSQKAYHSADGFICDVGFPSPQKHSGSRPAGELRICQDKDNKNFPHGTLLGHLCSSWWFHPKTEEAYSHDKSWTHRASFTSTVSRLQGFHEVVGVLGAWFNLWSLISLSQTTAEDCACWACAERNKENAEGECFQCVPAAMQDKL